MDHPQDVENPSVRGPAAQARRASPLGAALLLVCLASQAASAADSPQPTRSPRSPNSPLSRNTDDAKPKKLALKETVTVPLVQLEVTVWPRKADTDACLGLTLDDFDLHVDNKPRRIYAVDSLGAELDGSVPEPRLDAEAPGVGGLSLVLFFDLWHLDLFYPMFAACPMTKRLAFSEARKLVHEQLHEGDRLLLVTSAGWPVVHYGWIRTRADALRALDRLEKNRQVIAPRKDHLHHLGWIAGMESLFLALGRYPGRKDVIYLADDFRFDDVAMRMYAIAARAQSNGVVMSSVDLLSSCRAVPGPGPSPNCPMSGGLGCTEFRTPVALNPLSRDTGGALFHTDQIQEAVQELRSMRKCRYLVSFWKEPHKSKRIPSVRLELRGDRTDLTLLAPSSFQTPERSPSRKEKDEALFLLPHFGRGIAAEVGLWPYRPAGKRGRWKAFVLARVERTDEEPWPEELTQIHVNVLPHTLSQDYGEYRKTIAGADLQAFRTTGGTRLLLFPVEGIRPGDTTVDVTVTSDVEEISANVRRSFDVPDPPRPGEAGPWFLSDRVVRIGGLDVMTPSLDDVASAGQPLSFIGYGCRPRGRAPESYEGLLVPFAGGASVPVPVTWLDDPDSLRDGCGWLVGRVPSPHPAGLWTFEPPAEWARRKGTPAAVEFSVVSTTAPATLPAEVMPR